MVKLNSSRLAPHRTAKTTTTTTKRMSVQSFVTVLFKSQFVVPVIVSFLFVVFLLLATSEMLIDSTKSFVTFLSFNVMILMDMLVYLCVEPRIHALLDKYIRVWKDRRLMAVEIKQIRRGRNYQDVRMSDVSMQDVQIT